MQKQVNSKQENLGMDKKSVLKGKFEEISSQPATREVKLRYKSCCGCGCSEVEIMRVVPFNSELQNGDKAEEILDGDVTL